MKNTLFVSVAFAAAEISCGLPEGWFQQSVAPNKAFKPLAKLTRTFGTPHLFAHGFAILAQTALRTKRRLTGR